MSSRAPAPRPVRRRSSGLQTRAGIVAAAERHFARRGFEATRLDDIAAEAAPIAEATYDTLAATVEVDKAADAMQVNFFSMLRLIRAVIRPMMQARAGRIVAIGSVTSMRGNQGNGVYAATKGAIQSYCTTLAVEVARRGITVNTIAPGYVDTDMLAPYEGFRDKLEKQIPAQRYAQAGDVAALVRFLMSEEAGYLTGATLPVDGGLMASIGIQR